MANLSTVDFNSRCRGMAHVAPLLASERRVGRASTPGQWVELPALRVPLSGQVSGRS